ncbi:SDR family NAD(P)-dependent oxidoreductase [Neolewinella litorea]|uniref:Glucose 1-dehydrogenase n=1 Tax=Neolewinella litorea TaxID=2562452 RepID=A0A4S4NEB6_9BACT|nr:glucose 1-dehydrogenase [Neolewinella litorea]THH37874.1 glucose 1-dehydrogenase [Neolewinella litorea]
MQNQRIRPRFDLTGRVAVVTGSSKGIGEAMARGLAEFGAKVVVSSRSQSSVDAIAEQYRQDGLEATAIACHVGDADDRQRLIERTIDTYGCLDILINNAATNPYFGPVEGLTAEAYHKTLDINLTAALQLSNLALPHLRASGHGSVIHISSIEGLHANPNFAAYNISKAGIIMLGKSQAREWAADNVRVNVICPGLVKTKLSRALWENEQVADHMLQSIPLSRMATPDEMAGLAVWLASDAASYVTGSVVVADGGMLG